MKRLNFIAGLLTLPLAKIAQSAAPTHLNVRDFGAVGDNEHDDSDAFQRTIEASWKYPNAIIHVPQGDYILDKGLNDGRFRITDRLVGGRWESGK